MESPSGYDTALICRSGHRITGRLRQNPEDAVKFCITCGNATISHCEKCDAEIRGDLIDSLFVSGHSYPPPAFCSACGIAYPWTEASTNAFSEAFNAVENISADERQRLRDAIPDILSDTARTPLLAMWFKKVLKKGGEITERVVIDLIVKVGCEAAKTAMGIKP